MQPQSNSDESSAYEGALADSIHKLDSEIELLKSSIATCTNQIFVTTNESLVLEMLKVKQLDQQRLLNFETQKREMESQLMVRH